MPFDQTRVIHENGRTLTVENDDGDRFEFQCPTDHALDICLIGSPSWKSGSAPEVSGIWIDDARHVATDFARTKGWLAERPNA